MRDLYLLSGMGLIALLIGLVLFFFGPSSLQSDFYATFSPTGPVAYTVLQEGDDAVSINDRVNYRVTSEKDLTSLWDLVYGNGKTRPAVPKVNFSNYDVLATFDGSHVSGGYKISTDQIIDSNGTRTIIITHVDPGIHCPVSKTPTSPFQIIQVRHTELPLSHQDRTSTSTCAK